MDSENRLGEFIRARRERVLPGDAGLPEDDRPRRVPGLRREELAQLAGVSTNYVVRLEQGRDRHPSPSVLDALASALQLDEAATAHLHRLGTPASERPRAGRRRGTRPQADAVAPAVERLLERLDDLPVSVMNRFGDVLATTPLAAALMPGLSAGVNAYRATFLDPGVRALFGDGWDRIARSVVAGLRAVSADAAGDPRLVDLVGELSLESEIFGRLWARHDVRPRVGRGTSVLHHPQVGRVELAWEKFDISGSPGQVLVIHQPEPGSASARALELLASLTAGAPVAARAAAPA